MLHPSQFTVNEAWIAFRINDAPIQTDADGAFNCLGLMDAASCFIFGTEFIPANADQPSELEVRSLLMKGQNPKQQLPKTLFIVRGQPSDSITQEAQRQGIPVVQVPEADLLIFIGEARDGFRKRFG